MVAKCSKVNKVSHCILSHKNHRTGQMFYTNVKKCKIRMVLQITNFNCFISLSVLKVHSDENRRKIYTKSLFSDCFAFRTAWVV